VKSLVAICSFCQKLRDAGGTEAGNGSWQQSGIYMDMHNFRAEDIELVLTYYRYGLAFYRQVLTSRNLALQSKDRP